MQHLFYEEEFMGISKGVGKTRQVRKRVQAFNFKMSDI